MRTLYLRSAFLALWLALIAFTAAQRASPVVAYPIGVAAAPQIGR